MYLIDIVNMGAFSVFFYEMLHEITVADKSMKSIDSLSAPIRSIIW